MASTKCELCKLSNMTDDLRKHPGTPQINALRTRLARIRSYDAGVTDLCKLHNGRYRVSTAQLIEHHVDREERLLARKGLTFRR